MAYNQANGYNVSVNGDGTSSVNFDIKKPVFSVVINNSAGTNVSNVSFTIKKPVFSVTVNNSAPITSTINFSIKKPIFSVNVQNGEIVVKFNQQTNYTQPYLSTNYTQG